MIDRQRIYKLHKRIMKNDMGAVEEIETLEEAKEIIKTTVNIMSLHILTYRKMNNIKEDF